jgi:hypothetical protein
MGRYDPLPSSPRGESGKKGEWKKEESLIPTTPTNKPSSFIHKPSSKITILKKCSIKIQTGKQRRRHA